MMTTPRPCNVPYDDHRLLPAQTRILLASYGSPGIYGLETLFGMGLVPAQVAMLTHPSDGRNGPVMEAARATGVEVRVYEDDVEGCHQWAASFAPTLVCSVHFRKRIGRAILDTAALGGVNLHPALLPSYRGCWSLAWALIDGKEQAGYSWHFMEDQFDTGSIVLQRQIPIAPEDTAYSLFHRALVLGMADFATVLRRVILDGDRGQPQTGGGDYHGRSVPYGGLIDPAWDRPRIERFIRAMTFPPLPPAEVQAGAHRYPVRTLAQYDQIMSSAAARLAEPRDSTLAG